MLQLADGKEHLISYLNSSLSDTGAHLKKLNSQTQDIHWDSVEDH